MISFKQYLINESKLLEGKQEFLKKYSSEPEVKDLVNKFWTIRQRLKAPQNDIDWWIKQPYDKFKKFVINFDTSKNKETRKQDSYTKEAENWGAVMFGKFGQYEAWFVPTYKAAVQLGRFYKGVSTKWCISTDNSEYFNDNYCNSEFIFLISDDKSLKNYQKIALQLTEHKDLDAVWDVDDNNIFDDIPEFLEQPINNTLLEFHKLNRSRHDNITKSIIAKNEEYLKANANKIVQNKLNSVKIIDKDTIPEKYRKYITSITIPNSITEIGEYAFFECESLQSISIPNSVTKIGEWAFSNCTSLKSIIIPDSVTEIRAQTFFNCDSLQSITIPNSVTEIGKWAFRYCYSLKSINIPNSVTKIGEYAFSNCTSLKSIIIPNSVTEIRRGAFRWCHSLQSITIPDSVTEIGESSFSSCTSLKSITIPNSVTKIGNGAFCKCDSLKQVIFSSNSPALDQIKNGEYKDWELKQDQIFIKK